MFRIARRFFSKTALSSNYFKLFSLPFEFNVNRLELSAKFKELQTFYHPDKHVLKSTRDQELAAESSAYINEAYKCLLDPYCRGMHMFEIRNYQYEYKVMDQVFFNGHDGLQ